ncbi:hypothetical protein SDC9_190146 [bioreactor metagenome]|uniref:Uncharacterized protein n=1 Tax=bioreactor metagenome TaxID=1076179 RepID=A0A645HWM1_9ZZZZ
MPCHKRAQPLGHDFVRAVIFVQAHIHRFTKNLLQLSNTLQLLQANRELPELLGGNISFGRI